MTDYCEVFKAKLVDLLGRDLSDKAKLVALAELAGIADKEELQRLLECGASTLRTARSALKNERSKSSAARNQALENEQKCSKSSETLEIKRLKSSALACATKELPTEVSITNSRLASQRDATDVMIESICRWMNAGDEYSARTWLNNTIAVFGQDTTTNSFMKLQADTASGLRIAFPLKTWTTIAQRLQAEAKAGKTAHGNRPIVSTPESLSRLFDAMEAAA